MEHRTYFQNFILFILTFYVKEISGALSNLRISNLGSESLEVSWDVTTDDTFSIDASISEIDDSTSTAPQILGTTSARWMRLNPGTEYKVKVGMIKRRMEVSTVIMYVTTAPAAPMEIKIMKFAHPVLNTFRVTGSKTMMYQVFGAVVSWDQPPIGGFDDFEVTVNPPDGDVRVPVVRRGGAATQGNTQQQRMVWDLTPGVMYEFVVRTIKNGVYSSPISGNQRMSPDAPNDIRVTSRTPTTATLSWDGEHRGILDNYVIETNPSDGEVTLLSGDPTQPSRRLGNLLPGAKHTAKVYSMMDGLLSFKPGVKEFYTPPAVPLGEVKSEEIRSESVFITWNRPRGELDYYEVVYYRTDQDYARLRERVWEPRLNVTALEPGRSYMTEIYSVSNDLYSEPLKQIIHTRPLPPNQVTTTATHDTVMITWKTQLLDGNTVIKYTIESENEANEVTTVTLGPGMTSTNISNLIPETKYRVTVTTMTNGVESDPVTLTIWTNPPISSDETKRTPDEPGTERKVTTTTSSIESTTEKYEALVAETTAAETTVAKRLSSETTSRPDDSKRTTKRSEQESTKATTKSTTRTSTSIKATTATSTEGETTKTPIPTTTASTTTSTSEPVITTTRKPADETTRSTRVATTTEKTTSSSTTESSTSKSEVTSETTSRRQTSGQASSTAPQPRTTTQPVSTIAARQTATETIVDSSKQTTTSSTDSSKSVSEWQSFPVVSQSTASTSLPATSGSIRRDEPTTDLPTPRTTTSPTTTKQTTTTTQSQRIDETTTIASTTASTSARQRSTSPKLSARTTDTVTSSDVKKSTAATETVSESKTTGPYSTTTSTTERVLARIDATQQYTSKESTTPKMETPTVAATTATQPHTPEKSVTSTIEPQTPDKGNRTQSTDPFETTTTVRSQTTKKPTTTGIGASITVTSTAGSTTRLMAHITHEYNTTPSKVPTTAGTTAGILPQTTKGFITTTDDVSTTVGTTANILRQTTKVFITTTDDVSTTVEETTKIQSHTTNGSTATESVRTTAGSTTRLLSPTSQKYTTTQGDVSTTAGTPTILSQGHRTTGTEAPTTWRSGTATTPRTQGDVSTTTGETPTILPQGHRTTGTEAPTPGRSGTATTPRTQDDVSTTAGETPTILSQGHGTTGTEASTTWRSGTATTSRTQGDVSTTAGETPTILPQGHRTTGTEAPTTGRSGTATTPRTQGDVSTTAGETPTIPSQGHRTTGTEASTTGRSGTATTPRTIRSETETSSQSTTKSQASTTSISQTSKPAFPPGQFKDQPTVEETTTSQNITSPPQFPVQTIPIEDGFITMCEPDNITVIVNKSIIGMYEKKYGPLHFNGRCMGVEHETYYRYTIAPNISDCGTMFVKNATHVNITNTLSNSVSYNAWRSSMIDEKTGVIIGRQDEEPHPLVNLHIRCTFPTDIQVITEFIPVYEEKMISFNVSGVGKFSAIMQLFRDANYRYPYYSSPLLTMSGRLRVGITLLKTLDDYITIAARKCWATPVPDADYSVSYPLIDDFCGMKGALSGKLEILENGESKRARFEGPVFKFITHSEVWLHCELKVCFKDSCDTDCSDDGVNSRQKREAVYRPKGPIVSAGPIRRRGPPSKKPKENTSSEPDNTEISDDSINKDTLIIIVAASLAALVLLLSVVIVIVCLKYRRTSSSDKEAITNPDFNSSSLERHCNVFENPYMTESETSSRRFAS